MRELRKHLITRTQVLLPDHPEEVEDVVQDVLLALHRGREAVMNPRAYALSAVRYRCSELRNKGQADAEPLGVLDRWPDCSLAA